ncbi:cytochrome c oxidase assembly protein [Dokdonella immobilis]|uniref:Cytochrome c oxidase assembly protein CtaG n=1 Tax=Dokdonella immobilis TaxID=578942 RepID=A0A1I4WYP2_9GAMM|nr:cytochrome c oxidase assembly protein [Dokdonella immobilis]SFN18246.1 cytochrome c oxidase assembly protein subunit 11 [Dokdonella immobilis]
MKSDSGQHESTPRAARVKHDARGIAKTALFVVGASFLFGFAMVPIYRIACEHVLGIKLSGEAADAATVAMMKVDESRTIAVEFVASVNSKLPWAFSAEKARIEVHPGALTEVWFDATNESGAAIVGNAVPSVAPSEASPYFNKTECFCFTEQTLEAGESRRMPVRFVVDPQLPAGVKTLTLSYTFYANELATGRLGLVSGSANGVAKN